MNPNDVATALQLAMQVAPNGTVQQRFSTMVNQMRADGAPDRVIVIELCSAILDGLRYENWPL